MAKLIYFMPTSLDGYIADDGNVDWSTPSEEAFAFITDRLFQIAGNCLYTEDASGAGIPSAGGSRVECSIASRYFGGWSDPCRPRDPGRARRRASSARRAYLLGGGIRVLPSNFRVKLDLLDERRFADGWVYLRYHTQA